VIWLLLLGLILFLVAAHEGGHFLAAKLLGVAVEEFSIGFGPVLFSHKRKETRYSLRAFPLGGFVRLAGEGGEASQVPFERTYYGRPAWVRFSVSLAGPVANILLAGLLAVVGVLGFGLPRVRVVGLVPGAPAEQALQVGDVLLAIADREVWEWEEVGPAIQAAAPKAIPFLLLREGRPLVVEISPRWEPEEGRYLVGAYFSPQLFFPEVRQLAPDSPLAQAGLSPGDRITAACGRPVRSLTELVVALEGGCRELTLSRAGEELALSLPGEVGRGLLAGASFLPAEPVIHRPGLGVACRLGTRYLIRFFLTLASVVSGVARGEVPAGEVVSGPVGLVEVLAQGVQAGGLATFLLIALISLNLAVFNLIPFPALDGARMAFALFEMISRRKVSPAVEAAIHTVGFMLLLGLMLLVTWRDILRLFG
jgi:regulator of sigma E protease